MDTRTKRLSGLILFTLAFLWIGFAQILIWITPINTASEAPNRHYPNKDTFSREEAFDLSFAIARDIDKRNPNLLLPTTLLLFASWIFFTSGAPQSATRSNDDRNT